MPSKVIFFISYLWFLPAVLGAQSAEDLARQPIAAELSTDANAVIRLAENTVDVKSAAEMHVRHRRIVTIQHKNGLSHMGAYIPYDQSVKNLKVSGAIFDAQGRRIKRIKKGDLNDVSATSGGTVFSDARILYYEYTPTAYPFTFALDYEYDTKNTAFLPPWRPIAGYYLSVEKSTYTVSAPAELGLRKKEKCFHTYQIAKGDGPQIHYTLTDVPALQREQLGPPFSTLVPSVLASLSTYHLEGVDGSSSNWQEFGDWMHDEFLAGLDDLPEDAREEVQALVAGVKDPMAKAKIVYKYVQDRTRYVSIQVGIGGWKPMAPSEVHRLGYGDCKALSFYAKSLLHAVGVDAYYTIIYGGVDQRLNLEPDFASMQGNHVILALPDSTDYVYLECTNQVLPFGFLGSWTDDRLALIVKEDEGKIARTSIYSDQDNYQHVQTICTLDATGSLGGHTVIHTGGLQYDRRFHLEDESKEELTKHYKTQVWPYLNQLSLGDIALTNEREQVKFTEEVEMDLYQYGQVRRDRIFFMPNITSRSSLVLTEYEDRASPLHIRTGYCNEAEAVISLPSAYRIEGMPKDVRLETPFGVYEVTTKELDGQVHWQRRLHIKAGEYTKEDYAAYRAFRKKISQSDHSKIALVKK